MDQSYDRTVASSGSPAFPLPVVRYGFYAFIFSIPIETIIGVEAGLFSFSKLTGYLFFGAALLQPRVCFKSPPRVFWHFASYLFLYFFLWVLQDKALAQFDLHKFITLIQMVVLFWVSYNLFQYQQLKKEALIALGAGCVMLSILQVGGGAAERIAQGRVSALSQDANNLASMLSLGLLTLIGLSYGRAFKDGTVRLLAWICFGSLAAGIVLSGSRGALLSLLAGVMGLMTKPGQSVARIKMGLVAIVTVGCLAIASYVNDATRIRWERTLSQGNLAGREQVMPIAWKMFTERPLLGWGPGQVPVELGRRFMKDSLDTHNGYLWVLTETGIVGSFPFFIGLWLCWRGAWKARYGPEGSLPFALIACVLFVNMSITWHYRKFFWVVLAYCAASELTLSKRRTVVRHTGIAPTFSTPVGYGLQQR